MSVQEYYLKFIKLAKYAPHIIPIEKENICRSIFKLGEYIQDSTKAAAVK